MLNVKSIRGDFPILQDPKYIYFDNAATSQRPRQVMEAVEHFYKTTNANPLRGLYEWSVGATEAYEQARHTVAEFVHAKEDCEIIFVRNATEALNLVAYSYAMTNVQEGDEIVLTVLEHHSNLLPWQMVADAKKAKLVFLEPQADGIITEEMLKAVITSKTKIVAMTMVSNVLGRVTPVANAAKLAHAAGAVLVLDGAQGVPHQAVDVQALDCDFLSFSGHKMLGPMGIGALYAKRALLETMPPFLRGGEMIEYVTRNSATYAELPHKFEAGTVNAADAVGMAAGIRYLQQVGFDAIEAHEKKLTAILLEGMKQLPYVQVYGPEDAALHSGIVTFNIEGCHPHDISTVLDDEHIAIRAGHHCAQPLMEYLQEHCRMEFRATARASVYFYNTEEEAERFIDAMGKIRKWLGF
ncbi:MAG: SufS family cysteine desulfurase [Lachnospiraceae bacterium]|nr:SufS family cysteine desulfurase [Lachnospiraceae bacterium]